jgi:hypothetical protein
MKQFEASAPGRLPAVGVEDAGLRSDPARAFHRLARRVLCEARRQVEMQGHHASVFCSGDEITFVVTTTGWEAIGRRAHSSTFKWLLVPAGSVVACASRPGSIAMVQQAVALLADVGIAEMREHVAHWIASVVAFEWRPYKSSAPAA